MPLLWLSLAFLAGTILADLLAQPAWIWIGLAGMILLAWMISRYLSRLSIGRHASDRLRGVRFFTWLHDTARKAPVPVILLLLTIFLGAVRFQLAQPLPGKDSVAWYNDQEQVFLLEGVVADSPDVRDQYTNLRLKVDMLQSTQESQRLAVKSLVLARVPPGGEWEYGDRLRLVGKLETPPVQEGFSYQEYLARQGVYTLITPMETSLLSRDQGNPLRAGLFAIRKVAQATVYQIFPDPEASLIVGILLGVEAGIPADVQEAFRATGTSHIIAISGFNISVLAGLFTLLFSRLVGRWWGALLAALGIAFYALLVGGGASVVRAALMGWLGLLATQIGRRQSGLNSLAIVAACMALFNPNILWDVGFQLSFMATLGLVLYADPIQRLFDQVMARFLPAQIVTRISASVGEYILLTLAAQVLVIPVMAYHFQRLSLTMLIANPLILPVQSLVMVLGGLATLAGMAFQPLGQVLGYLAWPFVAYTIRMVEALATIPGGEVSLGKIALPAVLLFYSLVFGLTFARSHPQNRLAVWLRSLSPAVPLTGLAIITILVWREAFAAPDGLLHLQVLDVNQGGLSGEAILIETPEGRSILINGGPSASHLSDALGRRLPIFARKLDFLLVGGVQNGQLQALPTMIERYPPRQVLWAGATQPTRASRDLYEKITSLNIPWEAAQAGQALDLGSGASLRVLATGRRGAVLLLEWQNFRALLPLGMSFEEMQALDYGRRVGRVSALLLADSGYAPLNPPEWIAALQPQVVLLSVSLKDTTGLPSPAALQAVEGYTLLRTDRNGWIELTTDGEQMWVEAAR